MLAGWHVRVRPHPGSRLLARWLPIAGFCALMLCGCSMAPMPIYSGFPAQPGAPGSAAPLAAQGAAAPAGQSAQHAGAAQAGAPVRHPGTYAALGRRALVTLEQEYYNGAGRWNLCVPSRCGAGNRDWGADSLTYALYLHWLLTGDPAVAPMMNALTATAPSSHSGVSDVPLWDSIAAAREYQITRNPEALRRAEAYFGYVADSQQFATGACSGILYQRSYGGSTQLKTLETDANYIKAAVLLYQITHQRGYLTQAEQHYQAVRQYYLSPGTSLYTVYVFDNGTSCTQVPAQYFGSANGLMIWNGYILGQLTGQRSYFDEAIATAQDVAANLGDGAGVYADLQAENDLTEPLVESMFLLAAHGQGFARHWLLAAANASAGDINLRTGTYGRFFDGPPPAAPVTAWQGSGGLALALVAAALDPQGRPTDPRFWTGASFVRDNLALSNSPVSFSFNGRAVAIIGTIGEVCCTDGHAQVFIDGTQTFDQTGIWQNKSSSGRSLPDSVLFAWRWPRPGQHTIKIGPAVANAKQGGSFFHMTGYYVIR
jgi:phage protein U